MGTDGAPAGMAAAAAEDLLGGACIASPITIIASKSNISQGLVVARDNSSMSQSNLYRVVHHRHCLCDGRF